ncbi:hypothetical protein SAMN04487891_103259 [Flagellimonas taeanensis]|uniref:Uncharacterized protein n=1 Tax=Flagellimonas taeanensis TaxID=1005926 RepID=A0A1M6TKS9_9FLAO|nr:hypothetical protein SAMN04487891_103259 [Allomuricauda taeanensis]SHK57595.1 hypothetical protein SAMN05216293_1420 [Allomuricauda taeanensis]
MRKAEMKVSAFLCSIRFDSPVRIWEDIEPPSLDIMSFWSRIRYSMRIRDRHYGDEQIYTYFKDSV